MENRWISPKANGWSVAGKVIQNKPNAGQTRGLTTLKGEVQPLLLPQLVNYQEQMECPCSCMGFSRSKGQYLDAVCWSSRLLWGTGDYVSNQLLPLSIPRIWKTRLVEAISLCSSFSGHGGRHQIPIWCGKVKFLLKTAVSFLQV